MLKRKILSLVGGVFLLVSVTAAATEITVPPAPVPGDYNGAAGDEVAIFRDGTGLWAIRGITRVYFGTEDDLPVTR